MNLLNKLKGSVENLAYKRCGECPSFWGSCDQYGEYDEGCSIGKDINEPCLIALLPKIIAKSYSNYSINKMDKKYIEWYEREGKYKEFKDEEL